jgi:phage baseplate assembly protein W
MKIEFDFSEPTVEQVADAIASRVLSHRASEYLDETDTPSRYTRRDLGETLRQLIDDKVEELVGRLVTEQFDAAIRDRIAAKVDEVVMSGWQQTDGYGNATGGRIDLRTRISDILTKPTEGHGYGNRVTAVAVIAKDVVDKAFQGEFGKEIAAAREKFRADVDDVVKAKLVESIKGALGLR